MGRRREKESEKRARAGIDEMESGSSKSARLEGLFGRGMRPGATAMSSLNGRGGLGPVPATEHSHTRSHTRTRTLPHY